MSSNEKKLLPFYFGSLPDDDRLLIERELLTDEELLVDYLDLKRKIENAAAVPSQPSVFLLNRLAPKSVPAKVWWISLAAGAAIAAGLALFLSLQPSSQPTEKLPSRFLFDSGAEQSSAANVL